MFFYDVHVVHEHQHPVSISGVLESRSMFIFSALTATQKHDFIFLLWVGNISALRIYSYIAYTLLPCIRYATLISRNE